MHAKIKILEQALKKSKNNSAQDLLNNWPELAEILIKKQIQKNIRNF